MRYNLLMVLCTCGEFVGNSIEILLNHIMADGIGVDQFLTALGEIAMGASGLSIPPIWKSETLKPRSQP
ncbi:hypothetical protein SUGI_0247910 [Cryptomeria japonica]|nr:hypothetical protein SUGI_0247910 [Cryptomeria japonica]